MQILKKFYHETTQRHVILVSYKDKENYYYTADDPKEEYMELIRKHIEA